MTFPTIPPETLLQLRTLIAGRYIEVIFLISVLIKIFKLIYYAIRMFMTKQSFEKARNEYQMTKKTEKQNPGAVNQIKKEALKKGKKYNYFKHRCVIYLQLIGKNIAIIIVAVILSKMTGIKSVNEAFEVLFREGA